MLVTGVPVQYQKDGETRGDFVKLIDWADPGRNDWLAVNQFSIKGPHHTRRPDIILFVNGLPLVVLELKNPADENADIWRAYDQIQTYKEQIPDLFQYNEALVISDGTEALIGSLSAVPERFMAWRTIDGATLDPLGEFNELQTLVRGVLAPAYLLDYLRERYQVRLWSWCCSRHRRWVTAGLMGLERPGMVTITDATWDDDRLLDLSS